MKPDTGNNGLKVDIREIVMTLEPVQVVQTTKIDYQPQGR